MVVQFDFKAPKRKHRNDCSKIAGYVLLEHRIFDGFSSSVK